VPDKIDEVDRVDTPDSGNAPDAVCSSLADDSLSQVPNNLCTCLGLPLCESVLVTVTCCVSKKVHNFTFEYLSQKINRL